MRFKHFAVSIVIFVCLVSVSFAQSIDSMRAEIYSKLKCCPCKETFAQCVCQEAKEMKAYIDALLESGVKEGDIFYRVAKKYSLNTIINAQIRQEVENRLIQESGPQHPRIVLRDPGSFDFGRVSKGQGKITKTFRFSNQGTSPLIITNIKTYCPCASASVKLNSNKTPYFKTEGAPKNWRIEVKPKEEGEIELVVDLASPHVKPGKLIREASVFSNDPVYAELKVVVTAEVAQ